MKTKLILSWMLLVILLCPASEGREKTTAGTLAVDHVVDKDAYTYKTVNGKKVKRVKTQCVALKRVRFNTSTGSAYATSSVFVGFVLENGGAAVVNGYIRGSANQGVTYGKIKANPVVESKDIPGKNDVRSRYKLNQWTKDSHPKKGGDPGRRARNDVAYVAWKSHEVRNSRMNLRPSQNGVRNFNMEDHGNAKITIPSARQGSSSWLKGALNPFAFAAVKAGTNQGHFIPELSVSTNDPKTNKKGNGRGTRTDNSTENVSNDDYIAPESLPTPTTSPICLNCGEVVSTESEHQRTCAGCGTTYYTCALQRVIAANSEAAETDGWGRHWQGRCVDSTSILDRFGNSIKGCGALIWACNNGIHDLEKCVSCKDWKRGCQTHVCPNGGNSGGNSDSSGGSTPLATTPSTDNGRNGGDSSNRVRCGYSRCSLGGYASSRTAHQSTCPRGHVFWTCKRGTGYGNDWHGNRTCIRSGCGETFTRCSNAHRGNNPCRFNGGGWHTD